MINKYWDPKYSDLIMRVQAWSALEGGYYDDKSLRRYKSYEWHNLSEEQMENDIREALTGLKTYFYCPDCGRKLHIEDAVVKRKLMNLSFKLDNALMPGWMKIQTSRNSFYMRFCGECAKRKDVIRNNICLIGCLALPLVIAFFNIDYFFPTFFICAILGFVLSLLFYNWVEKKKHPDEFARAYDGNALAAKAEA